LIRCSSRRISPCHSNPTQGESKIDPRFAAADEIAPETETSRPRLTTPGSFVLANSIGGPVDPRNFARREWLPACKAAGVSYHLHDLRHFGATALDEQGMRGKLRTEIVGHADERITNGVYTHIRRSRFSQAAGEFDPLRGVTVAPSWMAVR
jgi:integrase